MTTLYSRCLQRKMVMEMTLLPSPFGFTLKARLVTSSLHVQRQKSFQQNAWQNLALQDLFWPLPPRCSFQAILRENPYFEQILCSGTPPLVVKTPLRLRPLTKILDPRLFSDLKCCVSCDVQCNGALTCLFPSRGHACAHCGFRK